MSEHDQDRFARVVELFHSALALPLPARDAFLVQAAGDDTDLIEEVRKVLAQTTADGDITADHPGPEGKNLTADDHPKSIGAYAIREVLGEGGMGTIYAAEQREPVRRRVALKVVKRGLDTKAVLARFELERQALAVMNHPNIAKVLDAGTTATGQPFFVMELVRGVPIHSYCDKHGLSLAKRIELVLQVCNGVQHAHHKGLIHRDIKPSNVLVEEQDGKPVAKIIDFGLARAVDHGLTKHSVYTVQGELLGTPDYMSPEQAEMGTADIDTRTDVYSLGVLLYELLVGALPHDPRRLRQGGYAAMQRIICDETPTRPSTRLQGLSHAQDIAGKRSMDVAALARALRGELDWVTMRALERDRAMRYQTPTELGQDLERFLKDEPVQAGPPSAMYRLRKLARRYRAQFVAVASIFVTVTAGLLTSLVLYVDANEARAAQRSTLEDLERLADRQRLDGLLRRADSELVPEAEDRVPAMRSWLAEAEDLAGRLPAHKSKLEALRRRGVEEVVDGVRSWQFGEKLDQVLHDALAGLVDRLTLFVDPEHGALAEMRRSVEWSAQVKEVTVDRQRQAWDQCLLAIRSNERYQGLDLRPQVGLIPLGADPKTGLWEFWHPRSGERPARVDGRWSIGEKTGMVFVLIPKTTFWMGAQKDDPSGHNYDPHAWPLEGPPHEVTLDSFLVSKYEMSQGQWMRLAGNNPSRYQLPVDPVEMVAWDEATQVLRRHGLQLLSEAQWEYSCRGSHDESPWWTGSDRATLLDPAAINIADWSARTGCEAYLLWPDYNDGTPFHEQVDGRAPNPLGLFQVLGNVAEWCRDSGFGAYASGDTARGDGERHYPASSEARKTRPVRGGSWSGSVLDARASRRTSIPPNSRYYNVGVRAGRAVQ